MEDSRTNLARGALGEAIAVCQECGRPLGISEGTCEGTRWIGKYRVIREIARGGMGIVYEAEDPLVRRRVALKVLRGGGEHEREMVLRLHREAALAGRLRHPNIIPIYEVGMVQASEGQPLHFISMGYIEGPTLLELYERRVLSLRRVVAILEEVCRAVHYAHQVGIIHRDLKPSNILVEPGGPPMVADFGLATEVAARGELTRNGVAMGTPLYMPPEQAAGDSNRMSPATDVYALGATLYHGLAGRPPFDGNSFVEIYRRLLEEEPTHLWKMNRAIPRDLDAIVMRALEKEPRRRYPTAGALADDLRRWLEGAPIEARPMSRLTRFAWRLKRRWGLVAASFLAFAGLLMSGILAVQLHAQREGSVVSAERGR